MGKIIEVRFNAIVEDDFVEEFEKIVDHKLDTFLNLEEFPEIGSVSYARTQIVGETPERNYLKLEIKPKNPEDDYWSVIHDTIEDKLIDDYDFEVDTIKESKDNYKIGNPRNEPSDWKYIVKNIVIETLSYFMDIGIIELVYYNLDIDGNVYGYKSNKEE